MAGPELHLTLVTVHVVLFASLRSVIGAWRTGFQRLRAGDDGPATAALFTDSLRRGRFVAYLFWTLIVAMAWLGINQPS